MKLATFGFLISAIVLGGFLLGRVDTLLGGIAIGVCGTCVMAQIAISLKERR
jgi:hypothetical protein